jgi:hypothetical protein
MLDWFDRKARWRARWQRWWPPLRERLEACRARGQAQEEQPMADDTTTPALGLAVHRVHASQVLAHLDPTVVELVKAELFEACREELMARAVAEVEQAHDADLAAEREHCRDELAKYKAILDDELEAELERREGVMRQELTDAGEERYLTVRDQRDEARQAYALVTEVLVHLIQQLFPKRWTYLAEAGLTELRLADLNAILRPHNLAIEAKYRAGSARQVKTQTAAGTRDYTVFSLTTPQGADVAAKEEAAM